MQKFFSDYPLQKQLKGSNITFCDGSLVACRQYSFTPRFFKAPKSHFGFGKTGAL